jgi:hypothetical protein
LEWIFSDQPTRADSMKAAISASSKSTTWALIYANLTDCAHASPAGGCGCSNWSERIKATETDSHARIAAHVTPKMKRRLRALSGILFLLAFVALAFLLLPDLWLHFRPTFRHRQTAAFALIFVGASFICLQLSVDGRWRDKLKGVLLGSAFVLWGSEQYLPAGAWVTAIDSAVIAIFVVDLGLVIGGSLGRRP